MTARPFVRQVLLKRPMSLPASRAVGTTSEEMSPKRNPSATEPRFTARGGASMLVPDIKEVAVMEFLGFAAFAVLVLAWVALPLRARKIEIVSEAKAA